MYIKLFVFYFITGQLLSRWVRGMLDRFTKLTDARKHGKSGDGAKPPSDLDQKILRLFAFKAKHIVRHVGVAVGVSTTFIRGI